MKFELHVPNWRSYIPILDVVRNYRRRDFSHDLIAGVVLGFITIPQAVAYAFLAGLPAEAGLYGCIVPMLIYAILGSSRELIVGPVAVAAIMVAEAIRSHAPVYGESYLAISTVISLQAGILLWLLRVTQMGGIVNLLSQPVISGFVNAAALLIILSQAASLLGMEAAAGNPFQQVMDIAARLPELNFVATLIGLGSIAIFWATRHYAFYLVLPFLSRVGRQHPVTRIGPMVAAVAATVAVAAFSLDVDFAVAVVGHVPSGMPSVSAPPFDLALWMDLLPNSATIALVAYVESYSIGTMLAGRKHRRINANQELIALGAANIGAAFTGAYPVAGSFSRSSVNVDAGARTPMSAVFCMVVIGVTLIWLTPWFDRLPHAALAAIIIMSVVNMIDFSPIYRHWKFYHHDTYTHLITLGSVLLFGVETGLLVGVLVAVALFVRRSSKPHLAVVGRVGDSAHFRSLQRHDVTTYPLVTAVRIDENLYFANTNDIENRLYRVLQQQPETRHLLLVCSAINFIDTSGLDMLLRLNRNLERRDIRLHLAELKAPVMDQLRATELPDVLTGDIFFTTDQAMKDLSQRA